MRIQQLFGKLPIIGEVIEAPTGGDWDQFEVAHLAVPSDFKEFLSHYGSGLINDFLFVFNPFARGMGNDWLSAKEDGLAALRALRATCPDEYSTCNIFPEPNGLLPVGGDINGDELFWETRGSPDDWTIVARGSRSPEFHAYPHNVVTFIFGVIRNRDYCRAFSLPGRKRPFFRSVRFNVSSI
jgi:hypothetical protein